ncbi:unnamed protein product [Diplocarpon coronariae]
MIPQPTPQMGSAPETHEGSRSRASPPAGILAPSPPRRRAPHTNKGTGSPSSPAWTGWGVVQHTGLVGAGVLRRLLLPVVATALHGEAHSAVVFRGLFSPGAPDGPVWRERETRLLTSSKAYCNRERICPEPASSR